MEVGKREIIYLSLHTLRASLYGTFLQKDVVNQCFEFDRYTVTTRMIPELRW